MAEKLIIPTRDETIARYERDYRLRLPDARVGDGTLPGIDARLLADMVGPLYAEASRFADDAVLENKTIAELKVEAAELGLVEILPAVGASGFVTVITSGGGATILTGTLALYEATGVKYQCTATALYTDGSQVPVQAIDTGPNTDLPPGSTLKWQSPPSGLGQNATVYTDAQGNGLVGGRNEETQPELVARIIDAKANPAVAGNVAAYRKLATEAPGVAVQDGFGYPCISGPGTIGFCFTLRPDDSGGSRIPSAGQRATVKAHVIGSLPADDSYLDCAILSQATTVCLKIRWKDAAGWKDAVQWPLYETNKVTVQASPAPTATTFRLASSGSPGNPQVGQTIAFYDAENETFVAKQIKTVTGASSPWDIVCETALNASDTSYTPQSGDIACPWSELLSGVVPSVIAEFDKLGPGEQVASSYDYGGLRQKREPVNAEAWPSELTGRITVPIYALTSVDEVQVAEPTLPASTTVGTPGVSSYLRELSKLAIFPV